LFLIIFHSRERTGKQRAFTVYLEGTCYSWHLPLISYSGSEVKALVRAECQRAHPEVCLCFSGILCDPRMLGREIR